MASNKDNFSMIGNGLFDNERFSAVEVGPEGQEVIIRDEELAEFPTAGPVGPLALRTNFSVTDNLANETQAIISLKHIPSAQSVFFKAFITTFNDSLAPNYAQETVFGRTDPIYTYKNTTRNITINWKVPAETFSEAYENLAKIQAIARFVYPSYTDISDALTISQTPVVRLKVMNLLSRTKQYKRPSSNEDPRQAFSGYKSDASADEGALGVIKSLTFTHNIENPDNGGGVLYAGKNTVLPKVIDVNMSFDVIHDATLGFTGMDFNKDASSFPYTTHDIRYYNEDRARAADQRAGEIGKPYIERILQQQAEEREEELAEQARANAIARYGTAGGNARFRKDKNRIRRLETKAVQGRANENQLAKLDYLQSARSGQQVILDEREAAAQAAQEASQPVDPDMI